MFKQRKFIITSIAFIIWAAVFIYQSSFITINGQRYFSLFDDAMISLRYAWNFSHGHGLVFNPGEYVEGYTNFLMVLVMSLFTGLFNERLAVLGMQILGIFTVLGIGFTTLAIAQKSLNEKTFTYLSLPIFLLVLFYYPLDYWALMGMETGLLTLLLLLSYLFMLYYNQSRQRRHLAASGMLLGLAGITRPDIVVLVLPLALYLVLIEKKNGFPKVFGSLLLFGGLCAAAPLANLLFRLAYYGQVFPNTYYLKLTGLALGLRLKKGVDFSLTYMFETLPLWLLAFSGLTFNLRKERLLYFSTGAILLAYQIWTGGDAWYYWRFMTPAMPLLIILAVEELWAVSPIVSALFYSPPVQGYINRSPVWSLTKNSRGLRRIGGTLLFCAGAALMLVSVLPNIFGLGKSGFGLVQQTGALASVFLIVIGIMISAASQQEKKSEVHRTFIVVLLIVYLMMNYRFLDQIFFQNRPYQVKSNASNVNTALVLNDLTKEDASVGVFWAGALPYYTHRYTIDYLGKSDTYIASLPPDTTSNVSGLPGHNKYDLTYSIQQLLPTYSAGFKWGNQDLVEWRDEHYRQVEYKGVKLYLLKDSPLVNWELIDQPKPE
jgi:hypothetical protein